MSFFFGVVGVGVCDSVSIMCLNEYFLIKYYTNEQVSISAVNFCALNNNFAIIV